MSLEAIEKDMQPNRPRDSDRKTRVHLPLFDRIKFFLLFILVFVILVWAAMANDPILKVHDAVINELNARWWLIALFVVEAVRQIHFGLAETLAPYHGGWVRYCLLYTSPSPRD